MALLAVLRGEVEIFVEEVSNAENALPRREPGLTVW